MSDDRLKSELSRTYAMRFDGTAENRRAVWGVLVERYFQPLVGRNQVVLDLGCGWGEFINQVQAAEKFGMDLNPAVRDRLDPAVRFLEQNCAHPWSLPDSVLDVVFTSNFLEHLPSKADLAATLGEAHRCLKPGGRIICLGPNVKLLPGRYWDFWDHHIALTETSLAEALRVHGFAVEKCIARFLPYTMSGGWKPSLGLIRLYLRLGWLWPLFGRQFLVVGRAEK